MCKYEIPSAQQIFKICMCRIYQPHLKKNAGSRTRASFLHVKQQHCVSIRESREHRATSKPGWEATGRPSKAGVGQRVAGGWKISVHIVVRMQAFTQKAGNDCKGCCMGKVFGGKEGCAW